MHKHTSDVDSYVRASAYHSLGKASLFSTANAENDIDLKEEMEKKPSSILSNLQNRKLILNRQSFVFRFIVRFIHLLHERKTERKWKNYIKEAKTP